MPVPNGQAGNPAAREAVRKRSCQSATTVPRDAGAAQGFSLDDLPCAGPFDIRPAVRVGGPDGSRMRAGETARQIAGAARLQASEAEDAYGDRRHAHRGRRARGEDVAGRGLDAGAGEGRLIIGKIVSPIRAARPGLACAVRPRRAAPLRSRGPI